MFTKSYKTFLFILFTMVLAACNSDGKGVFLDSQDQGGSGSIASQGLMSIAVTPPFVDLAVDTQVTLTATGYYSDGSFRNVTEEVRWSFEGTEKLTNQGNGTFLAGRNTGQLKVSASLGNVTSTNNASVNVVSVSLISLQVTPPSFDVIEGENYQLRADANYNNGLSVDVSSNTAMINWVSSDTSIATVSNTGLVTAVKKGKAQISVLLKSSPLESNKSVANVVENQVKSIQLSTVASTIAKGASTRLTAQATFENGNVVEVTSLASYNRDNESFLNVATGGVVTAIADSSGAATGITASYKGVTSNKVDIVTTSAVVSSLALTPEGTRNLPRGNTLNLTVKATYSDGTTSLVTPVWTISESTKVTISASNLLTAISSTAGTPVTIKATFGGKDSNTISINVIDALLVSVTVTPNAPGRLAKGLTKQFQAKGRYGDNSEAVLSSVSWQSSDTTAVTIDTSGLATAVSPGDANIVATSAGVNSTPVNLRVTAAEIVSLFLGDDATLPKGRATQLTAFATYTDGTGTNVATNPAINWQSSDTNIAVVSNVGLVNPKAVGNATITATINGVSDSSVVKVIAPVVDSIAINGLPETLTVGTSQSFDVIATYSDGTKSSLFGDSDLRFSYSVGSVISVSGSAASYSLSPLVGGNTVTLTATLGTGANAITAEKSLILDNATIVSLDVKKSNVVSALNAKSHFQFIAEATYSNGQKKDVTKNVSWNSTKFAIGSKTNKGLDGVLDTNAGVDAGMAGVSADVSASIVDVNNSGATVRSNVESISTVTPRNVNCYSQITGGGLTLSCPSNNFTRTAGLTKRDFVYSGPSIGVYEINQQVTDKLTYSEAVAYCTAVGGRVPTREELGTIFLAVDKKDFNFKLYTNYGYPTHIKYWTSDVDPADKANRIVVNMSRNLEATISASEYGYAACIL
ncbi:Ig-like domain-containing protein [Enterovibrio norvegicus]|uniref:Ig-like domain-containing protein n=1 Tax=Enterovibrio norvegicus TaxID=188144 RepID=UPI001F530B69|nr:Ig-like domain-containing protein [Enterovibrio norvegicus]